MELERLSRSVRHGLELEVGQGVDVYEDLSQWFEVPNA